MKKQLDETSEAEFSEVLGSPPAEVVRATREAFLKVLPGAVWEAKPYVHPGIHVTGEQQGVEFHFTHKTGQLQIVGFLTDGRDGLEIPRPFLIFEESTPSPEQWRGSTAIDVVSATGFEEWLTGAVQELQSV